jgi:DNA-binding beta-propeller fold protein YncE
MKTACVVIACLFASAGSALALDRSLYVINGLAETLSRVNLETGVVSNNIATLGLAPNQIFIDNVYRRDGLGYVLNSISHDLQLVDLATAATVRTIPLGPDRNPYGLAFLNDSVVAVTNLVANSISEVDTRNGAVLSEYAVGQAPEGVVYHNGLLYVCLTAFDFGTFLYGQGQVAVVDPELDSVIAHIDVGQNPQSAVIDFQGELLVLCTGDFFSVFGQVYVVDPDAFTVVDSIATGGSPGHLALSPRQLCYIAAGGFATQGEVYLFDSKDHIMLRDAADPITVGTGALATAADILGRAYSCDFSADRVSRIVGDSVVASFAVGDGPGFGAIYEPRPAGDVNGTGDVTSADIIHLVNYLFRGAPAPDILTLGDVNRNCEITLADVVTMVNLIFRSGPPLRFGCY